MVDRSAQSSQWKKDATPFSANYALILFGYHWSTTVNIVSIVIFDLCHSSAFQLVENVLCTWVIVLYVFLPSFTVPFATSISAVQKQTDYFKSLVTLHTSGGNLQFGEDPQVQTPSLLPVSTNSLLVPQVGSLALLLRAEKHRSSLCAHSSAAAAATVSLMMGTNCPQRRQQSATSLIRR